MTEILLVILMTLFDWLRGKSRRPKITPKAVCLLVVGWCVASLLNHPFDLAGLAITAGTALAGSAGVGGAIGPAISGEKITNVEKWQLGILSKNVWLSLFALGVIWGTPATVVLLIAGSGEALVPVIAFALATPLAAFAAINIYGGVVKKIPDSDPLFAAETARSNKIWAMFNATRSPLAGLLIVWAT